MLPGGGSFQSAKVRTRTRRRAAGIALRTFFERVALRENENTLPNLWRELQKKCDPVATAAEAWVAPKSSVKPSAHPQREDKMSIALYSGGATHIRDPVRFENVVFPESEVVGRFSATG